MTRDEFLTEVAELVAGLQVPVSVAPHALSAGYVPWNELHKQASGGFGWVTTSQCREAFAKILNDS
jgi:hypothetical protein